MSMFGDIIDALEAHWRTANLTPTPLPAGEAGFERGESIGQELIDTELPHVFAISPSATVDRRGFGQNLVTATITFELWVPRTETQENVSARLDALRALVALDHTLGGLSGNWGRVRDSWVSFFGINDPTHGRKERWAGVTVSLRIEEST